MHVVLVRRMLNNYLPILHLYMKHLRSSRQFDILVYEFVKRNEDITQAAQENFSRFRVCDKKRPNKLKDKRL